MRSSDSSQHRSLLRLARRGKDVFYVAPEFHTRRELSVLHSRGEVPLRSAFFDPKDIGKLTDEPHHIAYKARVDTAWVCSEPRELERPCGGEMFLSWLRGAANSAQRIESTDEFFGTLAKEIVDAVIDDSEAEQEEDVEGGEGDVKAQPHSISPAEAWRQSEIADYWRRLEPHRERLGNRRFAGYVSRLLLDCELVIVGHGEDI